MVTRPSPHHTRCMSRSGLILRATADSSWSRSEKAEAETPTEKLKDTVICGLEEAPCLAGGSQQQTEMSNAAFPSFPFCWWEEEIPPAHSGTGRKEKEVAQGKSPTQNRKPAISTSGGRDSAARKQAGPSSAEE